MAIKVNNNTIIDNNRGIVDIFNRVGAATSVLSSDGTSIVWKDLSDADFSGSTSTVAKGFVYFSAATV